jgi:DNA polymerase III epsilon subunit-like protein
MTTENGIPAALHGKRLVVVDVEGNGQQPPEIIEVAALAIDLGSTPVDLRSWLIRPQRPITGVVTRKVHGITDSDVADSPSWVQVAPQVAELLSDRTLVAHNAYVEYRTLSAHLPDWKPTLVLDTLRLAKHVWPGLPKYSLDRLIVHAAIDTGVITDSEYHRAAYDAWSAWQLLCHLVRDGDLDWVHLVKVATLPGFTPANGVKGGLW